MKLEIHFAPLTGYTLYTIDNEGVKKFKGNVSTEEEAREAWWKFQEENKTDVWRILSRLKD